MGKKRQRFLIAILRFHGDVLLTTPMINEIKRIYPESILDLLVYKGTGVLLGADERMRRYLRERDLKKHLKGKMSIEGNDGEDFKGNDGEDFKGTVPLKEKQNMTELEEDFEKDSQLHHAVSLLFGWDVMVSTFKNNQFEKIPPALPLAKINR